METVIAFFSLFCLALPGIIVAVLSLLELSEENNFKKNGIATVGKVVGVIPVRYAAQENASYSGAGSAYTAETTGGHFFRVEYEVENGDVYMQRTKKAFNGMKEEVSVIYSREKPSDAMIDGFYKVGNAKYYRIIVGTLWTLAVFSSIFF